MIEEKLRVVEETRAKGASVAVVARRHNLNANQVFAWRRQYRSGLLNGQTVKSDAKLLPVKVSTPTVLPSERAAPEAPNPRAAERSTRAHPAIEIRLRNGHTIVVSGAVENAMLARVIDVLIKR
jgi:transposase